MDRPYRLEFSGDGGQLSMSPPGQPPTAWRRDGWVVAPANQAQDLNPFSVEWELPLRAHP